MSPMQTARPQWWPYEAPPGLGNWGRQTDERLSRTEMAIEEGMDLAGELDALRDRIKKLEEAPKPSAVNLFESQNVRLVLWLAIAVVSLIVTGKVPDLSAVLAK